jgi:Cu(I)/Ag(I) efflux system membrane fusion protein
VYEGEEPQGSAEAGIVTVSPAAVQNLGVRTATVERSSLTPAVETFGAIGFDESRISHVHVRGKGWVERLNVRVEGETVTRGQLLFEFFSPELISAASEYVRELGRAGNQSGGLDTIEFSRRKLLALGLAERQVDEIRRTKQVPERIQVYAPRSGAVVQLGIAEGMFIGPEMTLLSINDHDTMWIMADVIESQGGLLRPGMPVEARVPSSPGRVWTGTIDYIYPHLQLETRTFRVRIRVPNDDHALSPNMFASIRISGATRRDVLAIPSEALIRTGSGDRVVLAIDDGRFKPTPVKAGIAVRDKVEITEGVKEGDRVVTSAQFLIDSESSLSAGLARLDSPTAAQSATASDGPIWTEATVDGAPSTGRTVNLSHPPIAAIGWPAMTMEFAIDPSVPVDELTAGRHLRVGLRKNADGTYRVVAVEPAGGPR